MTTEELVVVQDRLLTILIEKRGSIDFSTWTPEELLDLRDRSSSANRQDLLVDVDAEIVRRMRDSKAGGST